MREVKPTQKSVPSSDIKDLFFNSGLLDIWATSLEHKYIDRFGSCHLTAAGMEWIFNELVTKFKIESEQALLAAGYAPAGTFQEGAEVVSRNGTVLWKLPDGDGDHYRWDGDLPKQVPVSSTPQSTGGIGKGAWISVGDASLRSDLNKDSGANLIKTSSGKTVEEAIHSINQNYVNNTIPPFLPQINTSELKLFIKNTKNDGQSDFYIVSRKADGANGYVAMGITNVAGAASNVNTGGRSPVRPSETLSLTEVYVGLFTPYSKSWNVDVSKFDRATLQKLYGVTGVLGGNLTMSNSLTTNEIRFNNPQCYIVKKYGEIVYQVKKGSISVRLGVTSSSSNNVDISVSTDGVNFTKVKNINLKSSVDSTASYCDIEIDVSLPDDSYIKIKNESSTDTDIIYVIGLNIKKLEECRTDTQYDSAMISSNRRLDDIDNKYQHGSGASEFAAQQAGGKWFGTYHGGHSNFLQRLTLTSNRYSIDNSYDGVPTVELTEIVKLHSISDLTVNSTVYKYIASTVWGQGGHVTDYTIELKQGEPIVCSIAYTNMCTTAPSFKYVHHPVLLENITTNQDIAIGQTGFVEQYNAYSVRTLRNYFTQVPMFNNENGGAFIRFDQYYNKIYYAITLGKSSPLLSGNYTTCKTYS